MFAICDRRKGTILRVQMNREYAEALLGPSRRLVEAWIQPVDASCQLSIDTPLSA